MNDTLKIVIFVIGALIIVGILWNAMARTRVKNKAKEPKRAVKAKESRKKPELSEGEGDISSDLVDEMARAAEEAVAASRGEPHQAELNFEESQINWESMVKESLETRLKKVEPSVAKAPSTPKAAPKAAPQMEVVVLNLMAPRSSVFYGHDMVQILEQFGLSYGQHSIYHYLNTNGETEFSVALAIEPGYFDLDNLDALTAPGLTFFMDLHHVSEPKEAFKRMLGIVHEIASHLRGDILDHRRQRLTQASVTEYLARIKGFDNYRKAMNG